MVVKVTSKSPLFNGCCSHCNANFSYIKNAVKGVKLGGSKKELAVKCPNCGQWTSSVGEYLEWKKSKGKSFSQEVEDENDSVVSKESSTPDSPFTSSLFHNGIDSVSVKSAVSDVLGPDGSLDEPIMVSEDNEQNCEASYEETYDYQQEPVYEEVQQEVVTEDQAQQDDVVDTEYEESVEVSSDEPVNVSSFTESQPLNEYESFGSNLFNAADPQPYVRPVPSFLADTIAAMPKNEEVSEPIPAEEVVEAEKEVESEPEVKVEAELESESEPVTVKKSSPIGSLLKPEGDESHLDELLYNLANDYDKPACGPKASILGPVVEETQAVKEIQEFEEMASKLENDEPTEFTSDQTDEMWMSVAESELSQELEFESEPEPSVSESHSAIEVMSSKIKPKQSFFGFEVGKKYIVESTENGMNIIDEFDDKYVNTNDDGVELLTQEKYDEIYKSAYDDACVKMKGAMEAVTSMRDWMRINKG